MKILSANEHSEHRPKLRADLTRQVFDDSRSRQFYSDKRTAVSSKHLSVSAKHLSTTSSGNGIATRSVPAVDQALSAEQSPSVRKSVGPPSKPLPREQTVVYPPVVKSSQHQPQATRHETVPVTASAHNSQKAEIENLIQRTARNIVQSHKPERFKCFDAVIFFAREDYDSVLLFKKYLENLLRSEMIDVRIELFESVSFVQSRVRIVDDVIAKCSIIFIFLSRYSNTEYINFVCEEAIGRTQLEEQPFNANFSASAFDNTQRCILHPIHTEPPQSRSYRLPAGLYSLKAFNWYERDSKFTQDLLKELLKSAVRNRKRQETRINTMRDFQHMFLEEKQMGRAQNSCHRSDSPYSALGTTNGNRMLSNGLSENAHYFGANYAVDSQLHNALGAEQPDYLIPPDLSAHMLYPQANQQVPSRISNQLEQTRVYTPRTFPSNAQTHAFYDVMQTPPKPEGVYNEPRYMPQPVHYFPAQQYAYENGSSATASAIQKTPVPYHGNRLPVPDNYYNGFSNAVFQPEQAPIQPPVAQTQMYQRPLGGVPFSVQNGQPQMNAFQQEVARVPISHNNSVRQNGVPFSVQNGQPQMNAFQPEIARVPISHHHNIRQSEPTRHNTHIRSSHDVRYSQSQQIGRQAPFELEPSSVVSRTTGELIINPELSTDDVEIDNRATNVAQNRNKSSDDEERSPERLKTVRKEKDKTVNIVGGRVVQIGSGNIVTKVPNRKQKR